MAMDLERIQHARGTAAQWTAANPVLLAGEYGYETDTGFWKMGDGATAWASLAYTSALFQPHQLPSYALGHVGAFDRFAAYNVKPTNTMRLRASMGQVNAGAASGEWMFIGDSLMAGIGTGVGVYVAQQSWPYYMRAGNTAVASGSQADGLIRIVSGPGITDPRWTFSGSGWVNNQSWANNTTINDTATLTCTTTGVVGGPTAPGTKCSVWYYDWNDSSTFSITPGGNSATTVTCSGPAGWKRKDITGLTNTNTVVLKHLSGTNMSIFGATMWNANTLMFHNCAQPSSTATGTGNTSWTDNSTIQTPWSIYVSPHIIGLTKTDPDVVFIGLGVNDLKTGGVGGATNSTVTTAITTIAGAFPNSDIILVATQSLVGTLMTDATWTSYVNALYTLADTLGVPLLDWRSLAGTYTTASNNGYTVDGTGHYMPFANAILAREAVKALL